MGLLNRGKAISFATFCEIIKRIVCVIWLPLYIFGSLSSIPLASASEVNESAISISVNGSEFSEGDSVELSFNLKGAKGASAFIIEIEYYCHVY